MTLELREAVRALIVDDDGAILLVRYVFHENRQVWGLPGGGLEAGETIDGGLRRELHEELGLDEVELGPTIWHRTHIIPMDTGHDGQRDTVLLVRRSRFDPVPSIGWEAMRAERVHEMRWWSLDELRTVPVDVDMEPGGVRFSPRRLAELTAALLVNGPPRSPIDTGI